MGAVYDQVLRAVPQLMTIGRPLRTEYAAIAPASKLERRGGSNGAAVQVFTNPEPL